MTDKPYLKEWRQQAGLSQWKAATHMKVKQKFLAQVEDHKYYPNQPFAEAMAQTYGCTLEQLLTKHPDGT